ncbi:regulator of nonsense transcripts 3B-like [Phlebotomus papatasi]|uniref:regulator of nonsense transcripts 3B-like n=1 Tax=Phlebotomus papatasi TaxID=29031 RepID=UPI002483C891|nr:regulator of nonsense transcripts 3B-like [Phlebotomus papatasi]
MTEDGEKKEISPAPAKKEKPSRREKRKKDKQKPLTKVVIRRLPPTMTEEMFREQINPIPDHDYFYFVPADWTLGLNSSCRAYINFLKQEDIFIFKDKFDGYVFVDTRGAEYPAVVEFAPFQGLPKNRARKRDNKCNTIETESHYLAFLETLKGDTGEAKESKLEFTYQFKDDKKIKSTPLLEYIANKRQEKREEKKRKMEEKRRQREEEKQKKKNQVAKAIPAAIAEQEKEGDDEIIVRTIKSRTNDKRGRKDKEKVQGELKDAKKQDRAPLDEKAKAAKEERDRKRAERDQQRKLERERRNEERKKEKALAKAQAKPASDANSPPAEEIRREVKKYSERRREQRQEKKTEAQADQKKLEGEKTEQASGETQQPKDDEKPEKSNRQLKREKMREEREKQKEERQARRIRNKDRPSIQIYQPGRSRLSSLSKKTSGDEQGPEDSKKDTQQPSEMPPTPPPEAPDAPEVPEVPKEAPDEINETPKEENAGNQ